MSASTSRHIASMLTAENSREQFKAKNKAKVAANPSAALAALDPRASLKGVVSAKSAASFLSAPKPAPQPKFVPTIIPAPSVIPAPAAATSSKKKQKKRGVTLREDEVEFDMDFDAPDMAPPSAKKSSKKQKSEESKEAKAPETSQPMETADEASANSASLKKLKHRKFRESADSVAPSSSTSATSSTAAAPHDPFAPTPRPLSKAEKKKLEKLAMAKAKKAARKETLKILHASQMNPEQHKLLISTTRIGQKVTLKQELRRKFVEQKAGIVHDDENENDEADGESDKKKTVSLTKAVQRPTLQQSLDFFASTISPHIKPPKEKKKSIESLPAAAVQFADDFGSFRSSALSSTRTKGDGEDDNVGRGYVAGYIRTGKNTMAELEREEREREEAEDDEDEDDEEDEDEEGEDEEGEDDDDEEGEDDEDEDDEDEDDENEEVVLPPSNIYSVAFDVKPIRANKKKRKRVALSIPGVEPEPEEEEEEEEQAEEPADEEEGEEDVEMDEDDKDEDEAEEEEVEEEESDADEKPASKKQKATSAKSSKSKQEDDMSDEEEEAKGPKVSRKVAKVLNASVQIDKDQAGKKFSKVKNDGPSALYQKMKAAREEEGGTVMPYPGTEILASFRVSNNDLYLGDREEGKAVNKGKKLSKAAHEKAASSSHGAKEVPLPPVQHRMPTLRETPSGHLVVEVYRTEDIQAARMQLPVCAQEQEIMETINEHDIVIISGQTGSGKTTQVPQFLFEAGYSLLQANRPGLIGVTEPRRVAAISTAKRVAEELNVWNPEESKALRKKQEVEKEKKAEKKKQKKGVEGAADANAADEDDDPDVDMTLVSYQIRYARLSTESTRIKFMTDGILLREIQMSFLLPNYSVIIVDEAHERGINTDILIGLLSKIVPLRNRMAKQFLAEKSRREAEIVAKGGKKSDVNLSDLTPTYPLKLIIMSATLRLKDFTENVTLFPRPPPVLNVEARQYPVTVHFHKFTPLKDYTNHALKMIMKMHAKLPRGADNTGGILVFMTGKEEIDVLVRQVRELFDEKQKREETKKIKLTEALDEAMAEKKSRNSINLLKASQASTPKPPVYDENNPEDPIFHIDISSDDEDEETQEALDKKKQAAAKKAKKDGKKSSSKEKSSSDVDDKFADVVDMEDDTADMNDDGEAVDRTADLGGEDAEENRKGLDPEVLKQQLRELADAATAPAYVLPLYSMLPTVEQMKVFQPPPTANHRLIVISTNVAETSLTIPGIKYVLDVGREKARVYDRVTGTSQYVVQWISQASAAQRSGRSGRTGPGHAYRLYSSAAFDTQFEKFAPPEILRNPLEGTILQMLSMSITDLPRFPFPTPPEPFALKLAFKSLELLGAVEPPAKNGERKITELGRILASFPVAPRFGKMLVLACQAGASASGSSQHTLLSYMIRIVATLSVEQMWLVPSFNRTNDDDEDDDEELEEEESAKSKSLDPDASLARQKAREAAQRKKDAKRRQQRLYNEAQARWRHVSSDVLTNLRAIGGLEHVQSQAAATAAQLGAAGKKQASHRSTAFMQSNFLRGKAVEEIQALKKQLQKIAQDMLQHNIDLVAAEKASAGNAKRPMDGNALEMPTSAEESADVESNTKVIASLPASHPYMQLMVSLNSTAPLPPPTPAQETLLTQILCAGFIDHVARRMSPERKEAIMEAWQQKDKTEEEEEEGLNLDGAYECLATQEPVFFHPSSILFAPENQPDYCVYAELVRTKKLYMRGNTVLPHISWLEKYGAHLVTYSAPIQSNPAPIYDNTADDVLAYRDVVFGPNHWQLPRSTSSYPSGTDRCKHFLRLFLSGTVCSKLKQFLPFLLFKPSSITSQDPSVMINKSLSRLVTVFVNEKIDSRAKLQARWSENPSFFQAEYLSWVQPSQHPQVKKIWPPVEGASASSKKK